MSVAPVVEHNGHVFDRFPSRDVRRENFLLSEVLPAQEPVPKTWYRPAVTDQGREGACVGHGVTLDLIAGPRPDPYATDPSASKYAQGVYKRAQFLDPWSGEAYSGTSVDAGMKVARERGFIEGWRWMYDAAQVRDAVIARGPVVLGVDWYSGMYQTRPSGLVKIDGTKVGGHCITIIGYHPEMRIRGEDWNARFEVFKWQNSWGRSYGNNGVGYLRFSDLQALLQTGGEATVAWGRKLVRLPA